MRGQNKCWIVSRVYSIWKSPDMIITYKLFQMNFWLTIPLVALDVTHFTEKKKNEYSWLMSSSLVYSCKHIWFSFDSWKVLNLNIFLNLQIIIISNSPNYKHPSEWFRYRWGQICLYHIFQSHEWINVGKPYNSLWANPEESDSNQSQLCIH